MTYIPQLPDHLLNPPDTDDTEEIYQERIDKLSEETKEDLIGYLIEAQDEIEMLQQQVTHLKNKIA